MRAWGEMRQKIGCRSGMLTLKRSISGVTARNILGKTNEVYRSLRADRSI